MLHCCGPKPAANVESFPALGVEVAGSRAEEKVEHFKLGLATDMVQLLPAAFKDAWDHLLPRTRG